MTVGRQFENTFWEDPNTGDTHTWTRNSDIPRPVHVVNPREDSGIGFQGLLFHPLTGTGLQGDPMIPSETRRGIIQKALDLTDVQRYKKSLQRLLGNTGRSFISDKGAETHIERLTNTLDYSGMPTHVIAQKTGQGIGLDPNLGKHRNKPVPTVLDPLPGRAWAETGGTGIRMTNPKGSGLKTEYSREIVNIPSETPVANPKFWDQLTKARRKASRGDDHNSISADSAFELATHWIHPQTGHVMTREYAENLPIDRSIDPPGEDVENSLDTPALVLKTMGYVPNLFPGRGDPTAKNHSVGKTGKVETGYSDVGWGNYTYARFHNRFTPGTQEEKVVAKRVRQPDAPLSESTMTHELGHAMDDNLLNNTWVNPISHRGTYILGNVRRNGWIDQKKAVADPMEEGVADASADRYTRYKGNYEDRLANTEQRAKDFEGTGYTTTYGGWKNNTHRALYAATRFHAALGDNMMHAQPLPSRETVIAGLPKEERDKVTIKNMGTNDFLNTADSLALGHIYHHMPHVHGVLKQLGLDKAAKTAHADYKRRMGLDVEHPTLPGMEDFV